MGKPKGRLFNNDVDTTILKLMKEWGHIPNAYKKISKKIPQYSAKQIRQRWKNHLDPYLNHEPLDEAEKIFINQWVETSRTKSRKIHWKDLIPMMKNEFGKLRSENKIKNFWYPKKRSLKSEIGITQITQITQHDEPNFLSEDENEYDITSHLLLPSSTNDLDTNDLDTNNLNLDTNDLDTNDLNTNGLNDLNTNDLNTKYLNTNDLNTNSLNTNYLNVNDLNMNDLNTSDLGSLELLLRCLTAAGSKNISFNI